MSIMKLPRRPLTALNTVARPMDRAIVLIGHVSSMASVVMVVLTLGVVVLRYLFSANVIPIQETVIYLHSVLIMAGIAYGLATDAHVRVDIFYSRFSHRVRRWIDIGGTLMLLFPVAAFLIWSSMDYVALSFRIRESSAEPCALPFVYVQKALIPLMAVLVMLQGLARIMQAPEPENGGNHG